jgi:hypothetical protein
MAIRQFLSKAGKLHNELRFIDYRIKQLESLGNVMINNNIKAGDMILETLPNNGARPIIHPIYPPQSSMRPLELISTDENAAEANTPMPIGFQRMYVPNELKDSPLLTIFLEVDRKMLLSIVDLSIAKLKERKKIIFAQSRDLLEKPE